MEEKVMKDCKVLALCSQKGGVGKTTSCVNLAVGLAKAGKKVLVIDNDPQGSMTASLGYHNPDELPITLATILTKIVEDELFENTLGILHHQEGIDLIPANIELSGMEVSLVNIMSRELVLKQYIERMREMIINAHCHRNLLDESCIQVAVYDDRLEVTSPGGLYNGLTYEEVMNGHSKIRNKGIANIFSQMGLVEAWGSGIKRILNAAEEYGLLKPRFQEFDNMFRVELFRNSFPMTNEKENIRETSEKHRRSIGEASEVVWRTDLNDTQQKIIKLLSEDHQLSAVKLAEKIGVASRNIENNIKKLKEYGILIRHGSPKNGYWEIVDKDLQE